MKHENLFRAIGQVEETLIREAEETTHLAVPVRTVPWRQWCAVAAALALVIGLGAYARWTFPTDSTSSGADQEALDNAESGTTENAPTQEPQYEYNSTDGDAEPEAAELFFPALTVTGAAAITVDPASPTKDLTGESNTNVAPDEEGLNDASQRVHPGQAVACGPDGTLTLDFGGDTPQTLTVSWYQEDEWLNGAAPYAVETAQAEALIPPDGQSVWVAELTATWTGGGSAQYVFLVTP